jgi:hypothetical protein
MKIKKLETIGRVTLYETKMLLFSSKFLVLSILSFLMMDVSVRTIRQFAVDYSLSLPPAVLPFYFSDLVFGNIMYLFLVLLFSDIPLKQHGQKQILQRCGLSCHGLGQLLALFLVSGIFALEQFVFSILVCIPCLTFGEWGKAWGAVADTTFLQAGYTTGLSVSKDILRNYTDTEAVLLCLVSFILTGICYGLLIFLLNGISRSRMGIVVMSAWSVVWIFLRNNGNESVRKLMKYAPQSMNDLSLRDRGEFWKLMLLFGIILVCLTAVNMILIRKRKLMLVK